MTHKQMCEVINLLRPGAGWVLKDTDYENIEWRDLVQTKPTFDEITAKFSE